MRKFLERWLGWGWFILLALNVAHYYYKGANTADFGLSAFCAFNVGMAVQRWITGEEER